MMKKYSAILLVIMITGCIYAKQIKQVRDTNFKKTYHDIKYVEIINGQNCDIEINTHTYRFVRVVISETFEKSHKILQNDTLNRKLKINTTLLESINKPNKDNKIKISVSIPDKTTLCLNTKFSNIKIGKLVNNVFVLRDKGSNIYIAEIKGSTVNLSGSDVKIKKIDGYGLDVHLQESAKLIIDDGRLGILMVVINGFGKFKFTGNAKILYKKNTEFGQIIISEPKKI